MISRRLLAPLGAVVLVAATPALASAASWGTTGSGSARKSAGSLGAPTSVTVPSSTVTNGTVAVSWSGATIPAGATASFFVERKSGATYSAACGSTFASPVAGTSCNDTSVADGTYRYRVTTRLGGAWQATSGDSANTVTVTTTTTNPPQAPTNVQATIQSGAKFTPSWTPPASGTAPTGYECQVRSPQGTAVNTSAPGGNSGSLNTWFSCSSGTQVNTGNDTYTLYVRGVAGTGGSVKGSPSSGLNIDP